MITATRVSALAIAAILGLAAASDAQTPPPSPATGTIAPRPWGPGMRPPRPDQSVARLNALHQALNIRPDQETAFQAFAASMRPDSAGATSAPNTSTWARPDPDAIVGMTTPERLDRMARMMDERISQMRERFQRHTAAVKALYAVLDANQRHTLDALPALMGPGGMGMGMRPMGPRGARGGWGMGPHGGPGMDPPGPMDAPPPGDEE